MKRSNGRLARCRRLLVPVALWALLPAISMAADIDVFHADSLTGPMRELKHAFEAKNAGVNLRLTSGVSRELAGRILKGEVCDVFAPSAPAVIDEDLLNKKIAGSGQDAATWYVVFSANEMVVIVGKGNPLGIREVSDLLRPQVRFVRINGEKDLAAGNDVDILRFADSVNLSDTIRNAATVPGTARNPKEATEFVRFLVSTEAQAILQRTGQPPVAPPLRKGAVPTAIN